MTVRIERQKPVSAEPIKEVVLSDKGGRRTITVRDVSTHRLCLPTVECVFTSDLVGEELRLAQFKFVATLDDLSAFGQALIDISEGK